MCEMDRLMCEMGRLVHEMIRSQKEASSPVSEIIRVLGEMNASTSRCPL
jgi:hypothetical protein